MATPDNTSTDAKVDDARTKYADFINGFLPTLGDATHESRVAYFYNDSNGHLTIGIGHLVARSGSSEAKVRTAVNTIFKYGFKNKWNIGTMEFGAINRAIVPGPLNVRFQTPWMQFMDQGSRATLAFHHDDLLPGVTGGSTLPVLPNFGFLAPQSPSFNLAFLQPPTVDSLTAEAVKILALDIHYTDKRGRKHTYGAAHYESYNSFLLTETGIDSLGFDDVLAKIKEVKGQDSFSDFDNYPNSAKQAVIDLAFQYGAHGLSNQTKFADAVSDADWATAASNVPSGVAGPERTQWRADQLRAAVPPKAAAKPGGGK